MARHRFAMLSRVAAGLVMACSAPAYGWSHESAVKDIMFMSDVDGTPQKYVLILPPSFEPGLQHDVLIALHGHGSDRWQFVRDARDECRAARDVATRHRMLYVSPDYRASTSWMGPAAEADMVQVITDVKRQYLVRRVFVCGGSMGGSASLTFAVLHPDLVDGVVSMNGTANFLEYANFQDAIAASFGGTKEKIPLEYKSRSAEYWPERLTMPVAITASGRDAIVPPESVLRLAAVLRALQRPILLIHRPDGGHETGYADAVEALEWVVRTAAGDVKDD